MTPILDTEKFCEILEEKGNNKKLHLALQSFGKRNKYSKFYYEQFLENSQDGHLGLETLDHSHNFRTKFEAPAVAFLANAHALIDAFPYVVFLSLKPLRFRKAEEDEILKILDNDCGWTDNFFSSILHTYPEHTKLSELFQTLMMDKDFLLLKKISNNNKHKFLTRILNKERTLKFEIINFSNDKPEEVDVADFFFRIHNFILPKIFHLYDELSKACIENINKKK